MIRLYNLLPCGVREMSVEVFRIKVKTWLLERPMYSVTEFLEADVSAMEN